MIEPHCVGGENGERRGASAILTVALSPCVDARRCCRSVMKPLVQFRPPASQWSAACFFMNSFLRSSVVVLQLSDLLTSPSLLLRSSVVAKITNWPSVAELFHQIE